VGDIGSSIKEFQGMDEAAIEAREKWRFKPAIVSGKPAPIFCYVEVNFDLN
jgi:hypothetical protein